VTTKPGAAACPEDAAALTRKQCEEYTAAASGFRWKKAFNTPDFPSGCYCRPALGRCSFNGKGTRGHDDAYLVCALPGAADRGAAEVTALRAENAALQVAHRAEVAVLEAERALPAE